MTSTSMWSDDLETPATLFFRNGNGNGYGAVNVDGGGPFLLADTPCTYNSATLQNGSSRSSEMQAEESAAPMAHAEQPAGSFTGNLMNDSLSEEDDRVDDLDESFDGLSDSGANLDILAVTNVLTMGMDFADQLTDMTALVPASNSHATASFSPTFHALHGTLAHFPGSNHHDTPTPASEPTLTPPVHANMPPYMPQLTSPINQHLALHILAHNLNPNAPSIPTTNALSPENFGLPDFIRLWAWQNGRWQGIARERGRWPWSARIDAQMSRPISQVRYMDLQGDKCDVQGIDWDDLGVTRAEARERRLLTYKNYVNVHGSDLWQEIHASLPCAENYFRFHHLDVRKNVHLAHFQLRNLLASTSRSQVFYPGQSAVHEFNAVTGKSKVGMKSEESMQFQVSTLAADHDTLLAGGFLGEYCFRRLSDSSGEVREGTITTNSSGITNHVQLHLSRTSSKPRAAFASNDNGFRLLDIETEKFVSETFFPRPINCSAISPDGRLRVMVGDQTQVLIATAEAGARPEILKELDGHGDYGFACAWADDGWTVATGFQDKTVKIWDARRWTNANGDAMSVCTVRSEVAGVRSLRFSPLGSGKRVLVAAEEADIINIYDAQTFQSKQTFDFFGEIGGVSFVNDGHDLQVLCCDRTRGGLFHLVRCGEGAERYHDTDDFGHRPCDREWKNGSYDWKERKATPRRLPRLSDARRRRRALGVAQLEPF